MTGLRASIIVSVTSFLLGILFTHWIADSLTLWQNPVTDAHLWSSARYYALLAHTPQMTRYALAGVVFLGGGAILVSLSDGQSGNLMFDGGSIFLYICALGMQLYTVLPALRAQFSSPSLSASRAAATRPSVPFPSDLRAPTLDLASANIVCSVALTGVLIFQAARWWADQKEDEADAADLVEGYGPDATSAPTSDTESSPPPPSKTTATKAGKSSPTKRRK